MEQGGGQSAAKHAKPPDGGEDRLSALPDEVLILILECLDTTAEAVRTGVLARRWRRLWPLLTKLCFHLRPDGSRIRELLDVPDAPELRHISVTAIGPVADASTAWLPAAARRLAGGLVCTDLSLDLRTRHNVGLPCFENATRIEFNGFCGLVLPSEGVFTRLTDLSLRLVDFHGDICKLGDVVSSPRCPCLQKLSIMGVSGLGRLSIRSESLLQMELSSFSVRRLTIVTPILQKLSVDGIFNSGGQRKPVASITAPQMVSLVWMDRYDPKYIHLGDLGQLQELQPDCIRVYGNEFCTEEDVPCLRLLQQFQFLYSLHLELIYGKDMYDFQYMLGDITLPQVMFLQLGLCNEGHAFGANLFHLLGMCIGLRRFLLVLSTNNSVSLLEEEFECPSDCICDQPKNWRTDELVLDHLEDVHIIGLQGVEHEVAFVQRLLSWATVLKSLMITLQNEVIEGKIEEFHEALVGFTRPEICIQFETSDK